MYTFKAYQLKSNFGFSLQVRYFYRKTIKAYSHWVLAIAIAILVDFSVSDYHSQWVISDSQFV